MELPAALSEAFDHLGRLRFDQYMELALYAPATGFFATDGSAGRRGGDFITSPEVGPLFGTMMAARLDRLWDDLDRPDPFTVVEAGAGRGALAISVRAADPVCSPALRWVMVERSSTLRSAQADHLDIAAGEPSGAGPHFTQSADFPDTPITGAVVANELLDNLPFRLVQRDAGRWVEVCVEAVDGRLAEAPVELSTSEGAELDRLVPDAPDGTRVPWQTNATAWVQRATDLVESGSVVVFDYCRSTSEMADRAQPEWLRTYRGHERGGDPFDAPATRDITVDVALDQLPPPSLVQSQADWLAANGIDQLVQVARDEWDDRAGIGDLEAIRARSVIVEAEALCDPNGLGGFTALEWR